MASLWSRLLKVDGHTIGPSSDFFDLGGHSLLLAKLSAALLKETGVAVAISEIIERPTLGELVELLDAGMTAQQGTAASLATILSTPTLR